MHQSSGMVWALIRDALAECEREGVEVSGGLNVILKYRPTSDTIQIEIQAEDV